jgi:hypothetical protein
MRTKFIVAIAAIFAFLAAFTFSAYANDAQDGEGYLEETRKPCPWKISKVRLGKWGNGKLKAGTWVKGSFPIPPGVSERPTWYINGVCVGKSQIHFNLRWIPNSSCYLNDKMTNTITVKFFKPPYNGASYTYTFYVDFSKIPRGGYKDF